jgi:outer membrane protein assembly factor BamE
VLSTISLIKMKLLSVFRRFATTIPVLACAAVLSGCNYVPSVTPYRMEILQGNLVTQEMVSKLTPGLTKDQVRFVLGTPLVIDSFRDDRWDYVFLHMPENVKVPERRRVTVYFEDGKLKRVDGDVVTAARPAAAVQGGAAAPAAPLTAPASPEAK